jgi:hypothetical protein
LFVSRTERHRSSLLIYNTFFKTKKPNIATNNGFKDLIIEFVATSTRSKLALLKTIVKQSRMPVGITNLTKYGSVIVSNLRILQRLPNGVWDMTCV